MTDHVLEPSALKVLDDVQAAPVDKLDVDENDVLRDEGESRAPETAAATAIELAIQTLRKEFVQ
jgi:hypothetical protein